MNKRLSLTSISVLLLVLPVFVFASIPDTSPPTANASLRVIDLVNKVLNFLWPLFMGFAVIMFLVAGFLFLSARGDKDKLEPARQAVLWGVVGIVVGILAFSIPFIIKNTLGL